jgi:hypothetical protein
MADGFFNDSEEVGNDTGDRLLSSHGFEIAEDKDPVVGEEASKHIGIRGVKGLKKGPGIQAGVAIRLCSIYLMISFSSLISTDFPDRSDFSANQDSSSS